MKTLMMTTMSMGCLLAMQASAGACGGSEAMSCKPDKAKDVCATSVCAIDATTAADAAKCGTTTEKQAAAISTESLATLIRAKVPVIVLDARSGKYDDGRRITGAKALAPTAKDEEVNKLLPDKKALIVTYCAGLKCPASQMLHAKLSSMGYVNVLEYREGIEGWVSAGNAIEQAAEPKGKE